MVGNDHKNSRFLGFCTASITSKGSISTHENNVDFEFSRVMSIILTLIAIGMINPIWVEE